jgi:hypothetical protein
MGDQLCQDKGRELLAVLERTRAARLHNDSVAYQPVSLLSKQDFVRFRGLLETLGYTHSLAGEKSMSLPVVASNDLTGVEPNPLSQLNAPTRLKFVVEDGKCIAHLNGGPYGPKSVILVQHRHAKCGHDLVTDIPVHSSTVPLDNGAHLAKVAGEKVLQRLRIQGKAEA